MTQQQKYDATLFNQFLREELRKAPSEVRACIGRALRRFSPEATPAQLQEFMGSIYETIVNDHDLLDDWETLIIENHWDDKRESA